MDTAASAPTAPVVLVGRWSDGLPVLPGRDVIVADTFGHRIRRTNRTTIYLSPTRFRVSLALLAAPFGSLISHQTLIHAGWGDRKDGGPEAVENSMKAILYWLRPRFAILGLFLRTEYGQGIRVDIVPSSATLPTIPPLP